MRNTLQILNTGETTMFAAQELARYLRLMAKTPVAFEITHAARPSASHIALGVFGDGFQSTALKGAKESADDDRIIVNVKNGAGIIAGSNQRSVLIAVYRFLHALGCRWVRPGAEGERIPRIDLARATARLDEAASFRHRVVCIEGAVSVENVVEMGDWAPKVGFSGYFMQFPDGYAFFSRWYEHAGDPVKEAEPFSRNAARAFTIRVEEEIRKRGMAYHAVGHGWPCRAIGLDISHWNPVHTPLAPGVKEMLAKVNGIRDFRWDRPMITSLCFSRADVRKRMVKVITDYSCQHPEVDFLHVWVDDGGGNKCECAACGKRTPSDWYVMMLHELDRALTAAGSKMRMVFIGYSDLLWAPTEGAAPRDPKRFSFGYANGGGSYSAPRKPVAETTPRVPPYEGNTTRRDRGPEEFLGFLRGWQRFFSGDSMLFEYYLGGGRQTFGQYSLARVIHGDTRMLGDLKLDGLISCQASRVFFPTGLPMYVMGQTLWQRTIEIDALFDDFFDAAFGGESSVCKEFIKVSAEEISKAVQFGATMAPTPAAPACLAKLDGLVLEFGKVVDRNIHVDEPCHARSWYLMKWYLRLLTRMIGLFRAMTGGSAGAVLDEWNSVKTFVCGNEDRYQSEFDVRGFTGMFDRYIVSGKFSTAPENVVEE